MLFTTAHYALFLPLVFLLYWQALGRNWRAQNLLLLAASYYFYACWDWRFLFLLVFSTLLDYYTGLRIHLAPTESAKKTWLWLSVGINLGFLAAFKYYDFFALSMQELLHGLGWEVSVGTLALVLPVGISFYTFHGLSYVLDIHAERIAPERRWVDYALFVSFFPLLVAGPIERATHLLPQIVQPRTFSFAKAADGLRQILWGLFKKLVIADVSGWYVNMIFAEPGTQQGSTLALGAFLFIFQVYGDFSGYSDIALGSARILGFELARNFHFPLFSSSMTEFWRRWHISLSTWIRDYLFTPLALSMRRWGLRGVVMALLIAFTLNGLWHGANWTFILWGALHGIVMASEALTQRLRKRIWGRMPAWIGTWAGWAATFAFWGFSLIFFRATSLGHAGEVLAGLFSPTLLSLPAGMPKKLLILIALFMAVEWLGRKHGYGLEVVTRLGPRWLRWLIYYTVVALILIFGRFDGNSFIYFQF